MSAAEWSIFYKMQECGAPLGDWDISINYGIKTGLNDAFVINDETRDALIAADPKSAAIIKPILRGKDIRRWRPRWPGLWLIYSHIGVAENDYPAIRSHLLPFRQKLLARRGGANPKTGKVPYNWWQLQVDYYKSGAYKRFEREKLFWSDLTEEGRFAHWNQDEVFCLNSAYALSIPNGSGHTIGYLCATLNSRLVTWFIKRTALNSGMGVPRWIRSTVEQIPIPSLTPADRLPFANTTNRILRAVETNSDADLSSLEDELNRHVYDLYGLSDDEIQLVEGTNAK